MSIVYPTETGWAMNGEPAAGEPTIPFISQGIGKSQTTKGDGGGREHRQAG